MAKSEMKESLDCIIQAISNIIEPKIKDLKYDKTYRAKIIQKKDVNTYEVQINGAKYLIEYDGDLTEGQLVKVKAPLNNFSDIYIEEKINVESTLTSDSETDALSAKQGKLLNEMIVSLNTYSTREINTGRKWVDNKTIYRKVITFVPTTTTASALDHNIENVDKIWVTGESFLYVGNIGLPANYYRDSNTFIWTHVSTTSLHYRVSAQAWLNNTMYVTIEYTKTTD